MPEQLSRERLDTIIRMIVSARGPKVADEIADHIAALEAENERLRVVAAAARQAREALSLTREYVAPKVELPAVPGWSWYDATLALDTALAALDEEGE